MCTHICLLIERNCFSFSSCHYHLAEARSSYPLLQANSQMGSPLCLLFLWDCLVPFLFPCLQHAEILIHFQKSRGSDGLFNLLLGLLVSLPLEDPWSFAIVPCLHAVFNTVHPDLRHYRIQEEVGLMPMDLRWV